jgi:hypothetical protein
MKSRMLLAALTLSALALGFWLGRSSQTPGAEARGAQGRIFEMRTYTTHEGRLPALQSRFRQHTMRLFERHGMTNIGYWTPQDAPLSQNTLVYILAHSSREAAKKSWESFRADPEWKKAAAESEADGKIVSKIESVYLEATPYSPLK